jgi:hypothetical protein
VKIATIIVLVTLLVPQSASAHCFSRWYYHTPQHCGGSYVQPKRLHFHVAYARSRVIHRVHPYVVTHGIPDPAIDFVLPALVSIMWEIPLATKEQLELYEEMQRKKAILLLPHGE